MYKATVSQGQFVRLWSRLRIGLALYFPHSSKQLHYLQAIHYHLSLGTKPDHTNNGTNKNSYLTEDVLLCFQVGYSYCRNIPFHEVHDISWDVDVYAQHLSIAKGCLCQKCELHLNYIHKIYTANYSLLFKIPRRTDRAIIYSSRRHKISHSFTPPDLSLFLFFFH